MGFLVRINHLSHRTNRKGKRTGRTRGWQARTSERRGYASKLFSDGRCGGSRKARQAAEHWLKEMGAVRCSATKGGR